MSKEKEDWVYIEGPRTLSFYGEIDRAHCFDPGETVCKHCGVEEKLIWAGKLPCIEVDE